MLQNNLFFLVFLLFGSLNVASSFGPLFFRHSKRRQHDYNFELLGEEDPTSESTRSNNEKRIAIIGSGAVGCYYGSRLKEAGHDVCFYMREPHFSACLKNGLNVTSIDGDMFIPPDELELYNDTKSIGRVDWVIVALKSSSLDAIPDLVYPCLSKDTRLLAIMNGLIEDDLIRMLKEKAKEPVDDMSAPLDCCRAVYGGTIVKESFQTLIRPLIHI